MVLHGRFGLEVEGWFGLGLVGKKKGRMKKSYWHEDDMERRKGRCMSLKTKCLKVSRANPIVHGRTLHTNHEINLFKF